MARAGARRLQVTSCKSEEPPGPPPIPRHVRKPAIDVPSELHFQISSCLFALTCLAAQYVNLYHTVWWLPMSYQDHALNYHLIDRPTGIFVATILCRRLPCALFPRLSVRDSAFFCITPVLSYCAFRIAQQYGIFSLAFMLYPAVIYWGVFGATLRPLLSPAGWPDYPPDHLSCFAAKPSDIRHEAAVFKRDFNFRLKLILFDSLLVYYYASFEPCVIMPFHVQTDFPLLVVHGWVTWIGALGMFANFHYNSDYIDAVHRCAIHLGRWQKVEPRPAPHHVWSDLCFWPQNNLVKVRNKEYFRAEGVCNAAEPGNTSHARLYTLFWHPKVIARFMMFIALAQIATTLYMVISARYWYNTIAALLLVVAGSSNLFAVVRQYFVTQDLYTRELEQLEASLIK